jgi:hypothetical protein
MRFCRHAVSNTPSDERMIQLRQFSRMLPLLQTTLAISFGGWGLWLRNSILSRPFFGTSTGWDSTMRFHVWPWPLKFAVILNMPAFLAGALLTLPLDFLSPRSAGRVSALLALFVIAFFWYRVGLWADKNLSARRRWILLPVFILVCAVASSISGQTGGYTSFLLFGIAIWALVAIAAKVSIRVGARLSKVA